MTFECHETTFMYEANLKKGEKIKNPGDGHMVNTDGVLNTNTTFI